MQSAECPNRTQRRRGRNWRPPSECATDVEIGLLPSACGGTHAISSGLFRPSGSDGFIPMAFLHLQLQERQGADLGTSRPAYCMSQCLIINLFLRRTLPHALCDIVGWGQFYASGRTATEGNLNEGSKVPQSRSQVAERGVGTLCAPRCSSSPGVGIQAAQTRALPCALLRGSLHQPAAPCAYCLGLRRSDLQ